MKRQLHVAQEWATRARLALQEAGHSTLVTLDAEEANSHLNAGEPVLLVEVQKASYDTWTITEFTLRFLLISPTQSALVAWDEVEEITEQILEPLEIETAQLTMWVPENGRPYPCNLLTTTTTEMDE